MRGFAFISIILPCLNEEDFISQCLDSVLANDYPKELLEILVIDGMSEDKTRDIVESYAKLHSFIQIIDNPRRTTPYALNIGIEHARGEIIVRLDAHTSYSNDYISKCVDYLQEYEADNVGGIWLVVPRDNTLMGKAIAFAFSHPFGSGNAYYKTGHSEDPRLVDTVPFGCYRKELFQKIGSFDERLTRSQDMEFNKRLRKSGGRILLVPEIKSTYYVRSDLKSFFMHNLSDGAWAILPFKFVEEPVSLRHLVPLVFVGSLSISFLLGMLNRRFTCIFISIVAIYSATNTYFSFAISKREKDYRLLPYCFVAFLTRHMGYGLGSIHALPQVVVSEGFWRNVFRLRRNEVLEQDQIEHRRV